MDRVDHGDHGVIVVAHPCSDDDDGDDDGDEYRRRADRETRLIGYCHYDLSARLSRSFGATLTKGILHLQPEGRGALPAG